jgi:hypothetical protein
VKTRPFGREASILAEKRAKCVILKRNERDKGPLTSWPKSSQTKAQCIFNGLKWGED